MSLPEDELLRRVVARAIQAKLAEDPTLRVEDLTGGEHAAARPTLYSPEWMNELSKAATGTAIINTVLPSGVRILLKTGESTTSEGDQSFGDGSYRKNYLLSEHFEKSHRITAVDGDMVYPPDLIEAVAFMPVIDLSTGLQVPKVQYFDYVFNTRLGNQSSVMYNAPGDERQGGNRLLLRVKLQKLIADELKAGIEERPTLAREVVAKLVFERGGITQYQWDTGMRIITQYGVPLQRRSRPPYEQLGNDHRMYMVTPSELPAREDGLPRSPVARKINVALVA